MTRPDSYKFPYKIKNRAKQVAPLQNDVTDFTYRCKKSKSNHPVFVSPFRFIPLWAWSRINCVNFPLPFLFPEIGSRPPWEVWLVPLELRFFQLEPCGKTPPGGEANGSSSAIRGRSGRRSSWNNTHVHPWRWTAETWFFGGLIRIIFLSKWLHS